MMQNGANDVKWLKNEALEGLVMRNHICMLI